MVLEKLFASILNTVLAEFIEPGNLSQENLQIGVWSGYVVLEQLVLKKNLFDRSKTPLSLSYGCIGRLELRIPWKNIGYEPVVLVLDEVLMLVQPKYEWDDVKVRNARDQALKQAKLTASAFFSSSNKEGSESTGFTSYAEMMRGYLLDTLMRKMIDNFEVHIKSVHIRYEDYVSCPTDFCFGVSIEAINMTTRSTESQTTNSTDQLIKQSGGGSLLEASMQSPGGEIFRKDIEINNFAVYWNPVIPESMDACTSMFLNRADADIQRLMLRTLVYGSQEMVDKPRHHFLFDPHDIFVESDITFYKATVSTQANIVITVKDIAFTFEDRVFREIIALSANMSSFMQLEEFSMYRPKVSVREDARAWWRYAISAAIHQVQRRRERFSWMQISRRRDDKFVYIELWKCKLMGLKSGSRPKVKASSKVRKSSLGKECDPVGSASGDGMCTDSHTDASACYNEILAISHLRRAPIEAVYRPGGFAVPRGSDVSLVSAALKGGTVAEISSVCYYPFTDELTALFKELEERLAFEDISFFRSMAERDLAMEGRSPQTWLGGVSSWIFGSWHSASPVDMITDEDRRRLYESIHFDPEAVFAASAGGGGDFSREANQPSRMIASVSYNIGRMGVSLALSAPVSKYASYKSYTTPFLELELTAIHVDVTVMGTAVPGASHSVTNLSIGDFEAYEVLHGSGAAESNYGYYGRNGSLPGGCALGASAGKQYIKLISRKGKELRRRERLRQQQQQQTRERSPSTTSTRTMGAAARVSVEDKADDADFSTIPLVNVCVENDTSMKDLVDLSINIAVEELELYISPTQKLPQFLETFFTWPADLEFWSEMEMAAINEIADFQYVLSCKIDYMRRNHMNIELMANVKAPVLIITETIPLSSKGVGGDAAPNESPSSMAKECGYLIVDLGHISIYTEKLAKAAYEMTLVDQSLREMSVISGTEHDAPNMFSSDRLHRAAVIDRHRQTPNSAAQSLSTRVRAADLIEGKQFPSTPLSTRRLLYDDNDIEAEEQRNGAERVASLGDSKVKGAVAPRSLQAVLIDVLDDGRTGSVKEGYQGNDEADLPNPHDDSHDDPVAESGNNASTNDRVAKQDSLYDIFKLSITNCSAYMIGSLSELAEPMSAEDFRKCCIVDKYDINMNIHVSVLQWDKELPPVKLDVELPSVHFLLSEEKILRMVGIINTVTENSKRIMEAQKGVLSKIEFAKERMRGSAAWPSDGTGASQLQGYYVRNGSKMCHHSSKLDLLAAAVEESKPEKEPSLGSEGEVGIAVNLSGINSPVVKAPSRDPNDSDFDDEIGMQFFDASCGSRSRSSTFEGRDHSVFRGGDSRRQSPDGASFGANDANTEFSPSSSGFYRNQNHSSASRLSRLAGGPMSRPVPTEYAFDFSTQESAHPMGGTNGISFINNSNKALSLKSSQFYSAALFESEVKNDGTLPPISDSKYGAFIDSVDVRSEHDGEDCAFDSDADSDDSFLSVMEHAMTASDAKDLADSLLDILRQREVMAAHASEEMRLLESDVGKIAATKHRALQGELRQLEGEVQHLRISYVEALVRADEMKRIEAMHAATVTVDTDEEPVAPSASTVGIESNPRASLRRGMSMGALPHQEVIDSLSQPVDGPLRSHLANKRTLLQNSVFRPLPESHRRRLVGVRGGVGGNKELVRLTLEVSMLTVDFLCSESASVSTAAETPRTKGTSERFGSSLSVDSNFTQRDTPRGSEFNPTPLSAHGMRHSRKAGASNDLSPSIYSPSVYSPFENSPFDISSQCSSSPAPTAYQVPDTSLLRLQISGIKTSVKHKADDSKILFSVKEMFVEDIFQSIRNKNARVSSGIGNSANFSKPHGQGNGGEATDRAFLLTTDAPFYSTGAPSGLPRPRGFSIDNGQLVKLDTKVIYGKETIVNSPSPSDKTSRAFSSFQDQDDTTNAGPGRRTVMFPTTAKVNVSLGYVGINIDQSIFLHVYRTVQSLTSGVASISSRTSVSVGGGCSGATEAASEKLANPQKSKPAAVRKGSTDSSSGKAPGVAGDVSSPGRVSTEEVLQSNQPEIDGRSLFASVVTLKLTTRAVGVSVSLMHQGKAMLTSALWGITTSLRRYGDESLELKARVVDVNGYYLRYRAANPANGLLSGLRGGIVSNHPDVDIFYKEPIFGRPAADSSAPSIELSISGSKSRRERSSSDAKLRLSCLLECSALEVVVVPKVIAKIVENISSGPLVTMLTCEPSPSSVVPTAPSVPVFQPVSNALSNLFESLEGNMHVTFGALSVHVLSSYSLPTVSATSSDPSGNQISLALSKTVFDCAFGGECEFGGVEICQSILGISVSVDHQRLIEPFDVTLHAAVLHGDGSSSGGYYYIPDRSNSVFLSRWKPVSIDSISAGQILSSVSISPVQLNVHEGLIISLHSFINRNTEHVLRLVEKVSKSNDGADETLPRNGVAHETAPPPPPWTTRLGCSIGLSMLLYEASLSLQAISVGAATGSPQKDAPKSKPRRKQSKKSAAGSGSGSWRGGGLGAGSVGSGSWWAERSPTDHCALLPVPIIGVALSQFRSDIIIHSQDHAGGTLEGVDATLPFLMLKSKLRSFDICHLKAPPKAICRVLATISTDGIDEDAILSPTVSIHSMSGFSHYCNADVPFMFESPDRFLMFSDVSVSREGDIAVSAQISNANFVLLTDTFATFSSLALLYRTSLSDSSDMRYVREMATQLPTETMIGLRQKKSFEDLVAAELAEQTTSDTVQPETILTTTHPESRPLSSLPAIGNVTSITAAATRSADKTSGAMLIDKGSFTLPFGMKSLSVGFCSAGCGAFFPGSDKNPTVPGIYASANVKCDLQYVPIVWDDCVGKPRSSVDYNFADNDSMFPDGDGEAGGDGQLEMSYDASLPGDKAAAAITEELSSGEETCYSCWSTSVDVANVSVSLEAISFKELFMPLAATNDSSPTPPLTFDDEGSIHFDSEIKSTDGNEVTKSKTLLVRPFSAHLRHSLLVYPFNISHGFVVRDITEASRCDADIMSELSLSCPVPQLRQKVGITVRAVDVFAFVDYRPLLRVFKNCIQPLTDIPDATAPVRADEDVPRRAATTGASRRATTPSSHKHAQNDAGNVSIEATNRSVKTGNVSKTDSHASVYASSVFEVLANLHRISSCTINVAVTDFCIHVVNDVYREPVNIFRVTQPSIMVAIIIDKQSVAGTVSSSAEGDVLCLEVSPNGCRRTLVPDSHVISVSCVMRAQVEYQNHTLSAWEPLIEPFETIVNAKMPIKSKARKQAGADEPHGINAGGPKVDSVWALDRDLRAGPLLPSPLTQLSYAAIHSQCYLRHMNTSAVFTGSGIRVKASMPSVINVNVTSSLLDTIQGTVEEVQKITAEMAFDSYRVLKARNAAAVDCLDMRAVRCDGEVEALGRSSDDISLVTMRNDTGMSLRLWTSSGLDTAITVPADTSHSLNVSGNNAEKSDVAMLLTTGGGMSRSICLQVLKQTSDSNTIGHIAEYPKINNLQLEGDGCRLFLLEDAEGSGRGINFKAQLRNRHSEVARVQKMETFYEPNAVCIVTELISRRGVKTLLVRSTLYLYNALGTSMKVSMIVPSRRASTESCVWSAVIESNTGIAVPAKFCNLPHASLNFTPADNWKSIKRDHGGVIVDVPLFPGQGGSGTHPEGKSCCDETTGDAGSKPPLSAARLNSIRHGVSCKKKATSSPEMLSYAHWVSFPAGNRESQNAVLNVVSSGLPSKHQTKYSDSFLSRTVTLLPTVILTNCLAYAVEVAVMQDMDDGSKSGAENSAKSFEYLLEGSASEELPSTKSFSSFLASGDSLSTLDFHSTDNLILCFRLQNASTANSSWSTPIKISHCECDSNLDKYVLEGEIVFENGASLYVSVEVLPKNGVREVSLYVPYWLVTSSEFPVLFQHDSAGKLVSEKGLNGVDELCADQFFYDSAYVDTVNPDRGVRMDRGPDTSSKKAAFKLGPETACGGLLDTLNMRSSNQGKGSLKRGLKPNLSIWSSHLPQETESEVALMDQDSPYKVVHFSHSKLDTESTGARSGHVRLCVGGSGWSSAINLERLGSTTVEVLSEKNWFKSWLSSVRSRAAARSGKENEGTLYSAEQESYQKLGEEASAPHRAYSFGMTAVPAEYPFHRTKLVMVVDQFMLLNNTGQSLQVMQNDSDNVTSVSSLGSLALSWHSHGSRCIQLRLDQSGWKWSGGFDPMKEGDTSLRLRNEHDSTVYFILVHVVKRGPRVFVALKGGEKMATYRIENHTIRQLRLQQLDVNNVSTTLLQYHTCMYSWDEPMKEQKFKLDIDLSDNSTRWVSLGVYSFDRLMVYPRVGEFVVRVVARGPLRVLQIFPAGTFEGESNANAEGAAEVASTSDLLQQLATSDTALTLDLNIASVGISIIDRSPEELLYISVSNISMKHEIQSGTDLLQLSVGAVHVDNQLLSTPFPSMFSPVASLRSPNLLLLKSGDTQAESTSALANYEFNKNSELDSDVDIESVSSEQRIPATAPFVKLTLHRDFSYQGINFFPLIKLDILPFDINVESAIIGKLVSAVSTLVKANVERERQQSVHPVLARSGLLPQSRDRLASFYPNSIISTRKLRCIQIKGDEPRSQSLEFSSCGASSSFCHLPGAPGSSLGKCATRSHCLHRVCYGDTTSWRPEFLLRAVTQKALRELSPPADEVMKATTKIYIGRLEMSSVRMNISFNPGIFQGTILNEDPLGMNILAGLIHGVGSTMAVDNVPMVFRSIELEHLYGSAASVGKTLANKYTVQAVVQGLLVMLSLEAIGNPVHLAKTLWEGVYDFVSFPLQGLIKSPVEFINGLVKGTESLMLRLVSAAANTVNRVANNTRNIILVLRLVSNTTAYYIGTTDSGDVSSSHPDASPQLVEAKDETPSHHLVLGVTSNTTPTYLPTNVFQGLIAGVSGLLKYPYYGFVRGGFRGLMCGMLRGSLELFTKPLFGGLTGISFLMSQCQNWFSFRINLGHRRRLQRIRPPRVPQAFGTALSPYRVEEHVGTELLARVDSGQFRHEKYVCHFILLPDRPARAEEDITDSAPQSDSMIVLLTDVRVLIVGGGVTDYCELKWMCPVTNIARLARDSATTNVVKLYYSTTEQKTNASPLCIDEDSAPALPLRFRGGADCTTFLASMFTVRPELRTAHIAGLFAEKWSKSRSYEGHSFVSSDED